MTRTLAVVVGALALLATRSFSATVQTRSEPVSPIVGMWTAKGLPALAGSTVDVTLTFTADGHYKFHRSHKLNGKEISTFSTEGTYQYRSLGEGKASLVVDLPKTDGRDRACTVEWDGNDRFTAVSGSVRITYQRSR